MLSSRPEENLHSGQPRLTSNRAFHPMLLKFGLARDQTTKMASQQVSRNYEMFDPWAYLDDLYGEVDGFGQLEKQGTGNGTGTGMGNGNGKREQETKICAKLLGQR